MRWKLFLCINKASFTRILYPVNPKGKPEGRTRSSHKASDKFIVRRRKTGKKR